MASTDDIDTKAAVRKFLERRSVVDREDEAADTADELQAVLESVALSFLLYPQAALGFVLKAKNTLQQVVTTDLEVIDYLITALKEVTNPSEPIIDTSEIVEAQTALVEVDRVGRVSSDVKAYDRYNKAIRKFLDKRLAKSLKRNRRGDLERTGLEAKQDIFRMLSVFGSLHSLMQEKLKAVVDSLTNFNSVDLTRIVSTRTLTSVRNSLRKVVRAIENQTASGSGLAVELLAGLAALESISNSRKMFDPTVETGSFPKNRNITISSELVGAEAIGADEDVDLSGVSTPWQFSIEVDPLDVSSVSYSLTLPYVGASGRHFVFLASGSPTFNIPLDTYLYVRFDGIAPPANEAVMVRSVLLPDGLAVTFSDVLTALNDGLTGLIDGTAVEMAPDSNRILIYGSVGVTGITILSSVRGTFDGGGNYVPAFDSGHSILGFSDEQSSGDPNVFSPSMLLDILSANVPEISATVENDAVVVRSNNTGLLSSLTFGGVAENFGFDGSYEALPGYLQLLEDGEIIDPSSVGVFVGSIVALPDVLNDTIRNTYGEVRSIVNNKIVLDQPMPRCITEDVTVTSPIVLAVQSLLDSLDAYTSMFSSDARKLQQSMAPIVSSPTLAQINDANSVLDKIRVNVSSLLTVLQNIVVKSDQQEFSSVTNRIVASLEERGLDRSVELLNSCDFSTFFSLTGEIASKSSRFMKATEEVGRKDFSKTTIEQDMTDLEPTASTPDNDLLNGQELPNDRVLND